MGAIGIGSPQSRGRAIYGEAKKDKSVTYVAACDPRCTPSEERHRDDEQGTASRT